MFNYRTELPSTNEILKMNCDEFFFTWVRDKAGISEFEYNLMSFSERKNLFDWYNSRSDK